MSKNRLHRRVGLSIERLERREVFSGNPSAFTGVGSLTYSFAPDGTHVGREVSQIQSKFNTLGQDTDWREAFARAFQKWSQVSNINFGLVEDNGAASGVYGPSRGDERFGDIRITGFDFATDTSAEAVTENTRAVGTWAGDMVFNTATDWQNIDRIEAAALHEIGHILGLGHSDDPTSPMFTHGPSGILELTAQDISRVQAIHGPRALDSNEGSQGNDTVAKASSIKGGEDDESVAEGFSGSQVWIQFGDLHTAQDRDVYEIRTALGYTGPMTVEVRTQGLSQARLTAEITDRNGVVLASVDPSSPAGVKLLSLPTTNSAGKYYLHVRASTDPFWSSGDYSITIASPATFTASANDIAQFARSAHRWYYDSERMRDGFSWVNTVVPLVQPVTDDRHSDDTAGTSTEIPVVLVTDSRIVHRTVGTVSDLVDVDYYRVTSPDVLNGRNEMKVSLESLGRAGLVPDVSVYDDKGNLISTELRVHGYGQTELVMTGVAAKQHYFLKLNAESVGDEFKTGSFSLHVTFAAPSELPEVLAVGQLDTNNRVVEREWYVARPQLFGLSLEALSSNTTSGDEIWVSIFDANRNFVAGLVTPINELRSAPGIFLDAGTYYFQIASPPTAVQTSAISFRFLAERSSQPIGPVIGAKNVQPLFLCPGSTTVYCYPNSTIPTTTPQQVGPQPTVALPAPSTRTVTPPPDRWFWSNGFLPTNPTNALDTNGNGVVDPLDVLLIINTINQNGIGPVPLPPVFVGYLDSNANGSVDPLDALLVINELNR